MEPPIPSVEMSLLALIVKRKWSKTKIDLSREQFLRGKKLARELER